jgi:hypothetical protein
MAAIDEKRSMSQHEDLKHETTHVAAERGHAATDVYEASSPTHGLRRH